jgi:hypothetical protein
LRLDFVHRIKIAMTDSAQNWRAVPVLVQDMYIKYAATARELVEGEPNSEEGWILETDEIGPVLLKQANTGVDTPLGNTGDIDTSALHEGTGGFATLGNAHRTAQSWMGGPNPLTAMLLSGALAGGLGYGGGWLLHKLFPKHFSNRTPTAFGVLGGLGGAGSEFFMHGMPGIKHYGWEGMLKQQPLQGGPQYPDTEGLSVADYKAGSGRFGGVLDRLIHKLNVSPVSEEFEKHASAAGAMLPTIPTDEWGRVVLRDPFLDDREKALASGIVAGAGAMRGSRWVSPRDVMGLALNAGLGRVMGGIGSLAAKVVGLGEPVQQGLQRAGLLAGAVRGLINMAQGA